VGLIKQRNAAGGLRPNRVVDEQLLIEVKVASVRVDIRRLSGEIRNSLPPATRPINLVVYGLLFTQNHSMSGKEIP